ncbi:MAG: putative bifunctional diguanylate cyclase/phosphodiesterase [Steroidobacteraceae bacterium]
MNLRWGIGARLSVAFVAVAGLAVAANLLIEHEILVIRTRVVRIAVPTPSSRALEEQEAGSARSLIGAIGRYKGAVLGRLDVQNDASDTQLSIAVRDFERETRAYTSQRGSPAAGASLEKLFARLMAYRSFGDELVRAAESREQVLKEFWERFEALDARTKAAPGRSWKIFGRVVFARQSLVDLNSRLDEIRRGFASLPSTGPYDQGALDAVIVSEAALGAGLQKNAVALTRSQGKPWFAQTQADLTQINALQDLLILIDSQRRTAVESFAIESLGLTALVGVTKANLRQGSNTAAPADPLSVTETTSTAAAKPEDVTLIFWVSAAVLVLLLWISIHTVMSVIVPVRRMRAATRRLAAGAASVQIERGGIRELDDLAVSFNQMAEQLTLAQAVTRSNQEQLEAKVDLRTRELQHLAGHDPLTQLPNRRQLFTYLNAAIARAEASASSVVVFFVDLDNFKNINDSVGHAFGDRVLGAIAERLRTRAGPGFAARLGGDEFTIVCEGTVDLDGVSRIGWDLVHAFQQPVAVDGRDLMISISVGAGLYPDHGRDAEALLRAADAALFRAKALGRSQLSVFSPALLEAASAKFTTEQGLRYALERGEFELVFQPEVNARTLSAGIVEALVRWRLPDGRLASPAEFLAIAEESGLILEISNWVLRSAIETASDWHHGGWPEARVAINLSSRQLLDTRFVGHVMGLLREHRLPAQCIEIELTENVLQTGTTTIDVLRQLRSHGVAIALDDFGTGYSTLASLEQLPLSRVKLDRTLIASIHTSARSAAIARALVGLCHGIGLEVTAEGIECPEQLGLLRDLTPIHLQGYLLARPLSAEKLLPAIAALPDHMASLLRISSSRTGTTLDAPAGEHTVTHLRARKGK